MKNLLTYILVLATLLPLSSLSSSAKSFPQELFQAERDQPRLQKLFKWDNRIIAQAGEFFFEIDPVNYASMPIYFVGDRKMISLTTAMGKPFALGGNGDHYRVLFYRSGKNDWDMIRVPQNEEGKEDRYSIIVGDQKQVVVLGQKSFKIYDGKLWTSHEYASEFHPDNSSPIILWEDNIYYGYDHGEFGGGLFELNLTSCQWTEVTGKLPQLDYSNNPRKLIEIEDSSVNHVSSLCISPDGNLKVVGGLSHLGGKYGRIAELTEQGLKNELYISNYLESNEGWEYETTDFASLRFNDHGEPVLFTPHLGLLVYRNEKWNRLTPTWDNHFYVSSFIILNDDEYILGTYDAGVAIINLKKKTERVIRLATSFYKWEEK